MLNKWMAKIMAANAAKVGFFPNMSNVIMQMHAYNVIAEVYMDCFV